MFITFQTLNNIEQFHFTKHHKHPQTLCLNRFLTQTNRLKAPSIHYTPNRPKATLPPTSPCWSFLWNSSSSFSGLSAPKHSGHTDKHTSVKGETQRVDLFFLKSPVLEVWCGRFLSNCVCIGVCVVACVVLQFLDVFGGGF